MESTNSRQTKPDIGSLAAPSQARVLDADVDLQDEVAWRRYVAQHLATQTLSQQRTEWYARSTRLHVVYGFWLTMAGAIAGIILLVVLAMHTGGAGTTTDPYYIP